MSSANWLSRNTFHYGQFSNIAELVRIKERRGVRISLCFPTLNEEATIAKEIVIMRSELMLRFPLLDEIAIIDSGSTDRTREIAAEYGAAVFLSNDILPALDSYKGKGENLWKALQVLTGDIIVYIDADIKNIHHRFAYGLIGPLLMRDDVKYVKAFYDRPLALDPKKVKQTGGGRVTELVVRPLFSLYYPELSQFIQPLSGEYAGYREILERIPFPIGYGVETSMLLDIYDKWGMDVMAQVDLEKRFHRNQNAQSLGRMAFGIMQTFFRRMEAEGKLDLKTPVHEDMIQYLMEDGTYRTATTRMEHRERPPIITVPEYRERFGRDGGA